MTASLPLPLPTDDTLPPFAPTLAWARATAARLMARAGLAHFAVDIEPCDGGPHAALGAWQPLFPRTDDDPDSPDVAWFAGFAEGVCRFGLDMRSVTRPDIVVAALAREVALASGRRPEAVDAAPVGAAHAREVLRPELDTRDWTAHFAAVDRARALTRHAGLPVFRVGRSESRMRILFAAAGVGLATAVALALGLGTGVFAVVAFGLLIVGVTVGTRFEKAAIDECSDCPALIPPTADTCPGCGGTIAGRIASRDERLGAREALEARDGARDVSDGEDSDAPDDCDDDDGGDNCDPRAACNTCGDSAPAPKLP
jgi:hypothetical protein